MPHRRRAFGRPAAVAGRGSHSTRLWQMMDEEEVKEVSQVMSNLGSVSSSLVEKLMGRVRLADVGHRLADGLLRIHRYA